MVASEDSGEEVGDAEGHRALRGGRVRARPRRRWPLSDFAYRGLVAAIDEVDAQVEPIARELRQSIDESSELSVVGQRETIGGLRVGKPLHKFAERTKQVAAGFSNANGLP